MEARLVTSTAASDSFSTMSDDDNDDDMDGDNSDGRGIDEYAGEAGAAGSDDYRRRKFTLRYNPSVERPLLKKGGYVFDAYNALVPPLPN